MGIKFYTNKILKFLSIGFIISFSLCEIKTTNNQIKAEENFEITGEVNNYTHLSDAGNKMTKFFCPKCGSQIFGKNSGRPGITTIRAGTVNEKDIIKPILNNLRILFV